MFRNSYRPGIASVLIFFALWFAGAAVLFAIAPAFPAITLPLPGLTTTAAGIGFSFAYVAFAAWTFSLAFLISLIPARIRQRAVSEWGDPLDNPIRIAAEHLVLIVFLLLMYWPAALARYAPQGSEAHFLNVLWRMACGDAPYAAFELQHGPAYIGLLRGWIDLSAVTAQHYFEAYLIAQLLVFVGFLALLQHYIQAPLRRYVIVVITLPFLLDPRLALDQTAWQYILIVPILLVISANPASLVRAAIAGTLCAFQLTLSAETGLAAVLAALSTYMVCGFARRRLPVALCASLMVVAACGLWIGLTKAMLGPDMANYLASVGAGFEFSFSPSEARSLFSWNVHTAALLFVLGAALFCCRGALHRISPTLPYPGDLQLAGAIVFAVLMLRTGLQTPDYRAFAIPFVPMILMLLLDGPRHLLVGSRRIKHLATIAAALAAGMHLAGIIYEGGGILKSQARGIADGITGEPQVAGAFGPYGFHSERTHPLPWLGDLQKRLQQPDLAGRPAVFYGDLWYLPAFAGTCQVTYAWTESPIQDRTQPMRQTLNQYDEPVVVIRSADLQQLASGTSPPAVSLPASGLQRLLEIAVLPDQTDVMRQSRDKGRAWVAVLGRDLGRTYSAVDRVGDIVILKKR